MKARHRFAKDLKKELKGGMPQSDIQDFANEYKDITPEYLQEVLQTIKLDSAIDVAISQDSKKSSELYKIIDTKFIEYYKHLIAYRRGNNTMFYMYQEGVYKFVEDQDMVNLVSKFFIDNGLLQYRTTNKIKDTISNIGVLLSQNPKRYFRDTDVFEEKFMINLKNGLLDPETQILYKHTPEYFSTNQAPYDYDPEAKCPEFEKFIETITQESGGSDKMIQEMFGYTIGTNGNPRHKVFYMYGAIARNGKSTTAEILIKLIGRNNVSTLSLEQIASNSPSIMESIVGKRLNFSDEVSGEWLQSGRLTSISAEGSIEISPKFKPAYLHQVKAKFIVACNSIPRFTENNGMKHRMIIIPFKYQIPEKDRILNYADILIEKEGSGILNWALEGARRLNRNGVFTISDTSAEEVEENNLISNNVIAFIKDEYDINDRYTDKIATIDLYGERTKGGYVDYCYKTGTKPMAFRKFSLELKTFAEQFKTIKYNATGVRGYSGLSKRPEETLEEALGITDEEINQINY